MRLAATPQRTRRPTEGQACLNGTLTDQQRQTLSVLGVAEANVRRAASGPDLFAYVVDDHSTLRVQIGPDGGVVGQTVLSRAG